MAKAGCAVQWVDAASTSLHDDRDVPAHLPAACGDAQHGIAELIAQPEGAEAALVRVYPIERGEESGVVASDCHGNDHGGAPPSGGHRHFQPERHSDARAWIVDAEERSGR